MSHNPFHQFIKPTSPFQEGQYEGTAELSGSTLNEWLFVLDGQHYKVRQYNWDDAFQNNQWIKLGKRCTRWDEKEIVRTSHQPIQQESVKYDLSEIKTTVLSEINVDPSLYKPIKTGTYIDRFWSRKGGIMPGTNVMVTGDPGIGKSSVMMDLLQGIKEIDPNKKVLYVSAEMTHIDMMDPEEFLSYYPGLLNKVEFLFAGDYLEDENGPSFSTAFETVLQRGYDVVVLDSLIETQSIIQEEFGLGSGKKAEKYILNLIQKHNQAQNTANKYTAFLLIQQVNKDGEFAGSKRLVHMLTAFLKLKWDVESRAKRYMVFDKNRRGEVKMRLYFKLGKGVEYDDVKFEDEIKLGDILSKNNDLAEELTELELAELLTGKTKSSEDEIED
jgi:predicted ATP-dependent serine protease